jgi:sporulation integral membrane protein YlbJ
LNRSIMKTILIAAGITLLAASLVTFPQESLDASKRGLDMWWSVVFPSLLPFFIVSELLIGYGVVTFLGVILEPLMRPLFRVPGTGGFVWAMGMASGFPAGAKLTARLRQEGQINRIEAERLVSFTNASNPLFIFGAIAVGFFHSSELGLLLAISHYLGNFFVGLLMRFYYPEKPMKKKSNRRRQKNLLKQAILALHSKRIEDKKPFGMVLGQAVTSSIQTLLMIGGFIVLFSVFNKILYLVHIIDLLAIPFKAILVFLHLSPDLSVPFIAGIFEITLGSQMTSQLNSPLFQQAIITSFIIAFNGFSVHAQVASILAETDIRFKPFFIARIFHGFFAAIITALLWGPLKINSDEIGKGDATTVFQKELTLSWVHQYWEFLVRYGALFTLVTLMIYTCFYGYSLLIKNKTANF